MHTCDDIATHLNRMRKAMTITIEMNNRTTMMQITAAIGAISTAGLKGAAMANEHSKFNFNSIIMCVATNIDILHNLMV